MRKELRRSLFAAAIAGVALAGCGGGGGGGSPAPSPAPSPSPTPPPPPPPSAGSYFLAGIAGGAASAGTPIPFADLEPPADPTGGGQAPSLYGIQFVDPVNQPVPYDVGQGKVQLAPGGTALPLATVSEYLVSGSSITAWGTRYLVFASATSNISGLLYAVDLRKSGTTPANPAPVQLSSATVAGAQLCSTAPVVFDNYAAAKLSWIQFRVLGNDHNCGTLDDKFAVFQLSMSSTTAPVSLGPINQVELVQAIYNASGTITGFVAINHPATDPTTGFPIGPVTLQQYDATLLKPPTNFATPLAGTGHDVTSGDFLSLGITSGNVWLYWDYNGIYSLNLGTGAISQIQALTGGDRVDNGAVFDGANVYVPIDNTNGAGTWILQINESTLAPTSGPRDTTLATIRLVGETTGALVYFGTTAVAPIVTNLLSAPKSNLTRNGGMLNNLLSGNQTIDSLMGLGAAATPVAFLVGDTVYFTIADSSATSSTGFAKQAFYVTMGSNGAPGPTNAVANSVSAVLGAVAPGSVPTSGTVTNVGALVVSMGANALPAFSGTTGGADFEIGSGGASPTLVTSGSLDLFNASGAAGPHIGSLGTISPLTGNAVTLPASPVYWAALASGPVQAGMPAMLQLTGSAGNSPAEDIAVITPDAALTLSQDSDFAQ